MSEPNKQSNLLRRFALSVPPEDYIRNKVQIAEAKAIVSAYEEMNEAGKQSHDEFAHELEQKIREGEEARILLEQLKSRSTVQIPPSMPIQRPAIDYPPSTSRIEEVPNYDLGSGRSQQLQYHQFKGNQQAHNFVPQTTVQPVGNSAHQQLNSQQWTPVNAIDGGQSQQTSHSQYSQYSQQNIIQNTSPRMASYAPFGFSPTVRPQQQPVRQDQGRHDNYSRMAPTQERRHVPSHLEPLHQSITGSNQEQWSTTPQEDSSLQSMQTQVPGPSSHATRTIRPSLLVYQSPPAQNFYPQTAASQNQASMSATNATRPLWPPPHQAANIRLPANIVATSRPVAVSPQPNASSSGDNDSSSNSAMFGRPTVPVAFSTYPNPIFTNPKGDGTPFSNQTMTHSPPTPRLMAPTTLPSMDLEVTQYVREFREVVKDWEVKVPPNSYFDHPSNFFTVFKDPTGVTRMIIRNKGQYLMWKGDVDQFCDHWLRYPTIPTTSGMPPSVTPDSSSKPTQPAMSMGWHREQFSLLPNSHGVAPSKAIPSTLHKAIPSSLHKGVAQPTSSFSQSQRTTPTPKTHRPEYPQPSLFKQTPPAVPTSMHNQGQGSVLLTPPISTSTSQNTTSTSQFQLSIPSTAATYRVPAQTQPTEPGPETPSRQLSTVTNGVLRSVKQADKKFLAAHILFGLGKRPRELDTAPTALTEPSPKRHAQQVPGQVGAGVSPAANYGIGQATQAVQKPNEPLQTLPTGTLTVSQQAAYQTNFEAQQTSSESSSSDQQHLVHVIPSATTEVSEPLKTPSEITPLSLHDNSIVQATLPDKQKLQVALPEAQPDSQRDIISGDRPVIPSVSQPLAATTTVTHTATLPSPIPLKAPATVTSPLPSGINENTAQPVASSSLKQLSQPNALAKLQHSLISPVPSPLDSKAAKGTQVSQPLFLPSPESSPGIGANDDISISGVQLGIVASPSFDEFELPKPSSFPKRRNYAYVLVPPRPAYLVKQLESQRRSHSSLKRIRMSSRSSVSTSVAGEEDFYNAPESHSSSYAYEKQAIQLACSRLQELPCKWDGCSAKMNSVDALIRHLNRQHKPSSTSTSRSNWFLCRWTQCGRRCSLHERHLEKHAFLPLHCPYEDCDESFRSAPPLWKHMRGVHEKGRLKSSAQPSYPKHKSPAAIPRIIPTYMITTRKANPHAISSARHAVVGPWVLRNIAGLERERLTRQKSRRTVRGDIPDEDSSNDYDFLTAHPTRYSSHLSQPVDMKLDDLDSENISKMVDEGLTLWGGSEEPESDDEQSISKSPSPGRREHRSDQDEVEQMLTEIVVA